MANMGTVEFTAALDAGGVLAVIAAMDLMVVLLKGYGHIWTEEQQATLTAAVAACERENLMYSADPRDMLKGLACPEHGSLFDAIAVAPGDVARCGHCRAPLERLG